REIRQYLGKASNQVAELAALYVGLNAVEGRSKSVRVYTDSKYARGMLVNDHWEASANQKLVEKLRELGSSFDDLEVKWVEGHSGDPLNERADDLATEAVSQNK
ncbi:MAG: ribonuclease HI, partial [bacterium]